MRPRIQLGDRYFDYATLGSELFTETLICVHHARQARDITARQARETITTTARNHHRKTIRPARENITVIRQARENTTVTIRQARETTAITDNCENHRKKRDKKLLPGIYSYGDNYYTYVYRDKSDKTTLMGDDVWQEEKLDSWIAGS
ncbi:hypothetical protein F5Y04DRAFT_274281 [Hypomontagnella monticulosa]|nr:hypothetical protein F5Y04DRAFT_274281 [Hypomontagnella monticulosa]